MKLSLKTKLIILLLAFAASCSHQTIDEKIEKNLKKTWGEYFQENFNSTKEIEVFVATNRLTKTNSFGCDKNHFGINLGDKLWFGACKISVPRNHEIGEIPLAENNKQEDNNFFKIAAGNPLDENQIIDSLKKNHRTALIFVHGFNVQYQEALLRTAQINYDLKYQGPIVVFTWPAGSSEGMFEGVMINKTYAHNLSNAKNSVASFKNFLLTLEKNNIKPNLVVHSMGHQMALQALSELGKENPQKVFVNKLILNAPDFEAAEFTAISQNIKTASNHITLYCSSNDKAIIASQTLNKNDRLGACVYSPDIDTVDVGAIDNDILSLGHGYYSSRAVLNDVFQALLGIDVKQRLFTAKKSAGGDNKYFLRK